MGYTETSSRIPITDAATKELFQNRRVELILNSFTQGDSESLGRMLLNRYYDGITTKFLCASDFAGVYEKADESIKKRYMLMWKNTGSVSPVL